MRSLFFVVLLAGCGGNEPTGYTGGYADLTTIADLGTGADLARDSSSSGASCGAPRRCGGCVNAKGECVPECATTTSSGCSGCWDDANHQCLPGNTNLSCGKGGAACEFCQLQQSCNASGHCQGAGCNGCFDAVGICRAGTSAQACGKNGLSCAACAPNQQCIDGACVVPCNADTCSGCCAGNTCVPPSEQSSAKCGPRGAACMACTSGASCDGCACKTPTTRSCSGCSAGQCCDARTGTCLRNSNTSCGLYGDECVACSSGTGCGVLAGMCLPPGGGAIGAPCVDDGDCAFGPNTKAGFCDTDFAGGYCSDLCSSTSGCGAGAACVRAGSLSLCLKTCNTLGSFNECGRAGYVCEFVESAKVCAPQCSTAADCGNFPGVRCESFGAGNRCCGVAMFACCSGDPECSGFNVFGSRPSVCGENVANICS